MGTVEDRLIEQIANDMVEDKTFLEKLRDRVIGLFKQEFDDSEWDGSASNWDSAEEYCRDCLIDENAPGEKKIKDRCHLPFRKPGSNRINRNALRAMASGGRGLPALKGVSEESKRRAANWLIRIWPKAFGKPAPASIYRIAGKSPPEGEKGFGLFRDKEGEIWFVGIYSNKFVDEQGEIISEAAHQEYAQWVNQTGFQPAIVINHLPRVDGDFWVKVFDRFGEDIPVLNRIVEVIYRDTMFARAERIVPWHGFAVVLGKVLPDKVEVAEAIAARSSGKMSHGFVGYNFKSGENAATIIEGYRSFELSVLVDRDPANVLTGSVFRKGEKGMYKALSEEDRALLAEIFGLDLVEKLDQKMEESTKLLETLLSYKDSDNPEEETTAKPEEVLSDEAESDSADGPGEEEKAMEVEGAVQVVVGEVLKALNINELREVLAQIGAELKEVQREVKELKSIVPDVEALKKSYDERVAELISPINWKDLGNYVPSQAGDNVISPELREQLEKSGPSGSQKSQMNEFISAIFGLNKSQ